jgi:glucosamine--fructose-6-phosphate aminotransferase (isomerizing)
MPLSQPVSRRNERCNLLMSDVIWVQMSALEQEIISQPHMWRAAVAMADDARRVLPPAGARIAVRGCGTSWFMAQAVARLREDGGLGETDAFTPAEMLSNRQYDAVVVISRSGTTTEIVRALASVPAGIPTVAVTAVAGSPVAEASGRCILLEWADEQSVVQTRFATTALALFRAAFGEDLSRAIADAERALAGPLPFDPAAFEHFVFLGHGWTIGLANKGALKLREACLAWSEAYPFMEYRHGPISLAERHSVVWAMGDTDPGLLEQVAQTGATVVESNLDPMAQLVQVHRVAGRLAEIKGLDPDRPRHLTRSVVLQT